MNNPLRCEENGQEGVEQCRYPGTGAAPDASCAADAASGGPSCGAGASLNAPLVSRVIDTMTSWRLTGLDTPVLLMVSGGSDSTALAYIAATLADAGALGPCALLHVHHHMRGAEADGDAQFAEALAELLGFPFFRCDIDVPQLAAEGHGNQEAVARRERYAAAQEALASFCRRLAVPVSEGRILTAHTADDRIENFYMRSIVGTGPGGFRSMRYRNGLVARPLLDLSRQQLRGYLEERARTGQPVARDEAGALWREDATNAHTDRFRAYVRHKMVPAAREWNPRLGEVMVRTMNQIADEDDMLEAMARKIAERCVEPLGEEPPAAVAAAVGVPVQERAFLLKPAFGEEPRPLQKRVLYQLLREMLPAEARVQSASIDAVLAAFGLDGAPISGYVDNIQGNIAVSANKKGVRLEPMAVFRARRKRG